MATIEEILTRSRVIAVVGLSDREDRPSHRVARYLQSQGYRIIPVNPNIAASLGEKAYKRLEDVPDKIDIVNIFRQPGQVGPIVDTAIQIGAGSIWMQEGVEDHEAASQAEAAGLSVMENRCILKYHRRLMS